MRLRNLQGRDCTVSHKPHLIDWDPKREVSGPQGEVKRFLRPYWERDIVLEELPIPGSRLRLDLVNVNQGIVVEVSPFSSHSFNPFFHKSLAGFQNALKRDIKKEDWVVRIMGWRYAEIVCETDFPLSAELFEERFGIIL